MISENLKEALEVRTVLINNQVEVDPEITKIIYEEKVSGK
jgi:hypothetical protein